MDWLLILGGVALLGHTALCFFLQRRLKGQTELLAMLFSTPNSFILGDSGLYLLRARFFFIWQKLPEQLQSIDGRAKVLLALARLTGLLMPILLLSFFVASVLESAN